MQVVTWLQASLRTLFVCTLHTSFTYIYKYKYMYYIRMRVVVFRYNTEHTTYIPLDTSYTFHSNSRVTTSTFFIQNMIFSNWVLKFQVLKNTIISIFLFIVIKQCGYSFSTVTALENYIIVKIFFENNDYHKI